MQPYLIDCHDEAIALSMTLPATLDVSRQYSGNDLPDSTCAARSVCTSPQPRSPGAPAGRAGIVLRAWSRRFNMDTDSLESKFDAIGYGIFTPDLLRLLGVDPGPESDQPGPAVPTIAPGSGRMDR